MFFSPMCIETSYSSFCTNFENTCTCMKDIIKKTSKYISLFRSLLFKAEFRGLTMIIKLGDFSLLGIINVFGQYQIMTMANKRKLTSQNQTHDNAKTSIFLQSTFTVIKEVWD